MSSDSLDAPLSAIWTGVAGSYDAYRPHTPTVLLDLLSQLAGTQRPQLVVDLGSGTGLSTYAWSERADRVIGVEPNADMRRQAEAKRESEKNVSFVEGVAHETGLPDECADIVTASQSLHWMDPQPTFAEVKRILRPGGVFAAYDYDWPVIITPETDWLYDEFMARLDAITASQGADFGQGAGDHKEEHLHFAWPAALLYVALTVPEWKELVWFQPDLTYWLAAVATLVTPKGAGELALTWRMFEQGRQGQLQVA